MADKCPVCGDEGDNYAGTARGAVRHFFARTIWQLHKLRQAADAGGFAEMSRFVSHLIAELEEAFSRLFEERRH